MSNKTILERLLVEIDEYDKNRRDRDAIAQRVHESIEALEGIPYSVHQQGRDWQYKIETEGYFDEEGFESNIQEVIPKLKEWVNELIQAHS
jgi:FtsZ-binding cell division protein ZapB